MRSCKHSLKSHTKHVLLFVGAVTVIAVAATGCHGARHGWVTPERVQKMVTWHVNDLLDDLDADDAQRKQVHAIKDRLVAKGLAFHTDARGTHQALVQAWAQEKPDAKALHALVDQRMDALRAVAHDAVDASIELHAVLTPEQRQVLVDKVAAHCEQE